MEKPTPRVKAWIQKETAKTQTKWNASQTHPGRSFVLILRQSAPSPRSSLWPEEIRQLLLIVLGLPLLTLDQILMCLLLTPKWRKGILSSTLKRVKVLTYASIKSMSKSPLGEGLILLRLKNTTRNVSKNLTQKIHLTTDMRKSLVSALMNTQCKSTLEFFRK